MRTPKWTLLLCGVATVVFFVPALGDATIYDRNAILNGEWWRLITGNLVHLSLTHFAYDLVALLIVGTIIEVRGDRNLWIVYCMAGTVIGLAVYMTSPELRFYGGLSGITSAALVYLGLDGLRQTGSWRWLSVFVLGFVTIKTGIELVSGTSFLFLSGPQLFVPVPVSHLAGACSALFVFILTRYKRRIRSVYGHGAQEV
jgi:rhomboid family GlyGly-CTERM serine protease